MKRPAFREKTLMILGAIVLAGGRSRRMGRAKESLPFGDNTLLGRTVDTLLACTFPVIVVARDAAQELPPITLEADVVFDEQLDHGPMLGLKAGLIAVRDQCDAAFVTGCDAPFLTAAAVAWLANQLGGHDVVMPRIEGVLQPLCAVYRVSILPTVEQLIADGVQTPRSLAESARSRILTEAEIDGFDSTREFLHSVNSPDQYEAALRRLDSAAETQ